MSEPLTGVIADRQFLDLTALESPNDIAAITKLCDIQVVAVPESLAAAFARIPIDDVQLVVPVPDGIRPQFHHGHTTLGGDALTPDTCLIVLGALIFTTPVEGRQNGRIAVVGMVAAPVGSEGALGAALTDVVGTTHYYPYAEGQHISVLAGQVKLGPSALANESGSPDDILIIGGQVTVTGPLDKLGFREIVVAGQAMLPQESQHVFGSALHVYGQGIWYRGEPRLIFGSETYGRAFFELVEEPLALIIFGRLRIESDVPMELLRDKITGITLFGHILAPKSLIPVLQYRTTDKFGELKAVEDEFE